MTTLGELMSKDRPWAGYSWNGSTYIWDRDTYTSTWQALPLPEGGETCSFSDLSLERESQNDTPDLYKFPTTLWGDYVWDTVTRSNHRSLMRDHPNTFIDAIGDYGSHMLLIRSDYAGEDVEDLYKIGNRLRDRYPIYDEEDLSILEHELAEEAWNEYMKLDVQRDLERGDVDLSQVDDEDLRERFYASTYDKAEPFTCEDAVSVHFPYYEETIGELINHYRNQSGTK